MQIEMPFEQKKPENPEGTIGALQFGQVFRRPSGKTLYMKVKPVSREPKNRGMCCCVQLNKGTPFYEDPATKVVRVRGVFRVDDWGTET